MVGDKLEIVIEDQELGIFEKSVGPERGSVSLGSAPSACVGVSGRDFELGLYQDIGELVVLVLDQVDPLDVLVHVGTDSVEVQRVHLHERPHRQSPVPHPVVVVRPSWRVPVRRSHHSPAPLHVYLLQKVAHHSIVKPITEFYSTRSPPEHCAFTAAPFVEAPRVVALHSLI